MNKFIKSLFIGAITVGSVGTTIARGYDPFNGGDSTQINEAVFNANKIVSSTDANVIMASDPKAPFVKRNYNNFLGNSNVIGLYNDNNVFARIDSIIIQKYPITNGNLIGIKSAGSVVFSGLVGQPSTIKFVNNPSVRTINNKSSIYLEFIFSNGVSWKTCDEYAYTIVYDDGSSMDYSLRWSPIAGFGFSCR